MNHGKIIILALMVSVSACQANAPSAPSLEAADSPNDRELVSTQARTSGVQPAINSTAERNQLSHEANNDASLCTFDENVLFSCKIENSEKMASLCASKDVSKAKGHLYYAFGTSQQKELVFPVGKQPPANRFKRTQLGFAGNTGGYAYSFENDGRQYIIYSISGANGLEDQGILVARDDERKPEAVMACQQGSVVEADDSSLLDLTLSWDHDVVIEKRGLPARD